MKYRNIKGTVKRKQRSKRSRIISPVCHTLLIKNWKKSHIFKVESDTLWLNSGLFPSRNTITVQQMALLFKNMSPSTLTSSLDRTLSFLPSRVVFLSLPVVVCSCGRYLLFPPWWDVLIFINLRVCLMSTQKQLSILIKLISIHWTIAVCYRWDPY